MGTKSYTIKMLIFGLPAGVLFKVALFGVYFCSNALTLLGLSIGRRVLLDSFELNSRL
jgi:hypothetical protein